MDDDELTYRAVDKARQQIAESLAKGKKAKGPFAQREAVIDYLVGVSTLVRELGGPESTSLAHDLIGALEDLNQDIPNTLFAFERRHRVGRPLKSLQTDIFMAYACAAVDIQRPPRGEMQTRIAKTARLFSIDEKSLRSFRKKVTSKTPPSDIARTVYYQVIEDFRDSKLAWSDISEFLVASASGCLPK